MNMQNNIIITIFVLQIIVGNLARIIPLPIKFGNLSLTEIILYLSVVVYAILQKKILAFLSRYYISIFLLLLSGMIGVMRFGVEWKSLAYLIRLILMILSGYCISEALYGKFFNKWDKVFFVVCIGYLVNIFLGYLILILFPDSVELWAALSLIGIEFNGDPHQTRFVSTYLDPNFFSVIACIPLIMSFYLWRNNCCKKFSVVMIIVLVITELATLSRSGIATFVLTGLLLFREDLCMFASKMKLRKSTLYFCIAVLVIMVVFCITNWENAVRFIERFDNIENDPSALHRVDSLQETLDILSEYLILGIGYNFSDRFNVLIDSSILLLFLSFGLIISFIFVIIFFLYSWNIIYRNNKIEKTHLYYLFIVMLFSSWFNQVLTYPYWFLPYITIAIYLCKIKKMDTRSES